MAVSGPDVIRAFLDPEHVDAIERLAALRSEVVVRPDPDDDGGARDEARQILRRLGEHRLLQPIADRDLRGVCLSREGLAQVSPLADEVYALQGLALTPILLSDNDAMKDAWIPRLLDGTAMGAFAMTEPDAGSEVGALSTKAIRDGDRYSLHGTKTFISNAGIADVYVVFATVDPDRGSKGITAFVVPADTPGLRFVRAQELSAPHPLGEIALEGCVVPGSHRLGPEGKGLRLGYGTLDRLRTTVGAAACGMAIRALDEAITHARTRVQFGKPIGQHQLIQAKLARMATELTAARLLVYRAAMEKDRGAERVPVESAMAKWYATEAAQRVVDDAVQILGGRGVMRDAIVDRLYRAVRSLRVYEGTSEIQQLIIGSHLLEDA